MLGLFHLCELVVQNWADIGQAGWLSAASAAAGFQHLRSSWSRKWKSWTQFLDQTKNRETILPSGKNDADVVTVDVVAVVVAVVVVAVAVVVIAVVFVVATDVGV